MIDSLFLPAILMKLFEGNSEDSEDIIESGTRFNSTLPNGELCCTYVCHLVKC